MPTETIRRAEERRGRAFARVTAIGESYRAIKESQWELARRCIRYATEEGSKEREDRLREVNRLERSVDRERWATTREGA